MVAVNKLSLTLFKDQILVLLGHNGAGKTTTINMLTGHMKATEGAAYAYGRDLLKLESSTNLISVCPQTNVLLTKMTVKENLIFFSMFRGVDYNDQIIEQMLD
jgi:ATP-binding cassette subfamily A (ABC1) protein 3